MEVTAADVMAAVDVLRQAQEQSDDVDFDHAVDLLDALGVLAQEVRITESLVRGEMLRQVEEAPRQHGTRTFLAINDYKDRYDHDAIESRVVAWARAAATHHDTGEIDPAEAARMAAYLMRQIYVAPSTGVKKSALEQIEVDPTVVRHREAKGRKLHVVDRDA